MKKIFLFFFILALCTLDVWASWTTIISREQWWADESFTYKYSKARQEKIDSWPSPKKLTEAEENAKALRIENYKKSIEYINKNFWPQYTITEKISHEWEHTLAWPIQKSNYVNAIVVHHTHSEYEDSYTWIKEIYQYHSLGRAWWDIGYNYIIGYNGEIFEWRKGGDYTVAAHSKWNNISTVSIAVMWDYHLEWINSLQYSSLEKLVQELAYKYGIDLWKDYYYNSNCAGAACNIFPLETHLHKTLVWHRDTWHTTCPGDKLYEQIEEIRLKNLQYSKWFLPVKRWSINQNNKKATSKNTYTYQKIVSILKKLSDKDLEKVIQIVDIKLTTEEDEKKVKLLKAVRIISLELLKTDNH